MIVIAGLGNPGEEYKITRHNVGFMVVDEIARQHNATFTASPKTHSELCKISSTVVLCKPQTYMNQSGQAIRAVLDYYKLIPNSPNNYDFLYIVHDDLDLELGTHKLQFEKGPKSHNGILSVVKHLKSESFWRARIGVDNRGDLRSTIVPSEYVLKPFQTNEQAPLKQSIEETIEELFFHISQD